MTISKELERTLHRSVSLASERKHEYATLEHLLLGLIDDADAITVLKACDVNIKTIRQALTQFLDTDLAGLATDRAGEPKPTAGFQRVVQRAAIQVQSAGRDEVTGANALAALFSERESYAVRLLQLQDMTRLDAVNFISHGIAKSPARQQPQQTVKSKKPPELPSQGIGPHVEINSEGVISFPRPESIDRDGNHLPTLRSLQPDMIDIARKLCEDLQKGNVPHSLLADIVATYTKLIDQRLGDIDFRRLYAAGVRLANATFATNQGIKNGDLPPLKAPELEKLQSLLDLHGPFILATAAGAEAIDYELRYKRRPAEERNYREEAITVAKALQGRPDILSPDVADQVLGAASDIGKGQNPERSNVAGGATIRNLMIVLAGGAIGSIGLYLGGAATVVHFVGTVAISETIKKTGWFKTFTQSIATQVDGALDASSKEAADKFRLGLNRQAKFVMENEGKLRALAGDRKELGFVHRALDWLKDVRDN